jgi:hypothetical protein
MGGDLIDARTIDRLDYRDLQALAELPFVLRPVVRLEENGVRIVVDEAATAIPPLLEWFSGRNISIATIEEYHPPFDDVFVELVKKETPHA